MLRCALTLLAAVCTLFAKVKPDPRLRDIKQIFVAGNNEAADKIRSEIRKDRDRGRVCFSLVTRAADADATLEVGDDSVRNPGLVGGRHDRVTRTLTLKSGDLIWSQTASFSDAPFMSGVKTAAGLVYGRLKKDACTGKVGR